MRDSRRPRPKKSPLVLFATRGPISASSTRQAVATHIMKRRMSIMIGTAYATVNVITKIAWNTLYGRGMSLLAKSMILECGGDLLRRI